MNKIEILTPVHVGTGEKIEAPCFYREGDSTEAKRYNFSDILTQMPSNVLTNPYFLKSLMSKQNSKVELYKNINRYVDYSKLRELYGVYDDNEEDIFDSGYDVYEQIKDLDKPYIPGSSIKGALINAWFYYLVKIYLSNEKNHAIIERNIENILKSKNADKKSIINFLFDSEMDHSSFVKALNSCLVCRDVYFNQIEVLWSQRFGSGKDMMGQIPMSYMECIQCGQIVNTEFMYIDEKKKANVLEVLDTFTDRYMDPSEKNKVLNRYKQILNAFNEQTIYKACSAFARDVLEEDCKPKYKSLYSKWDCPDVNVQNEKILKEIKDSIRTKEKVAYLRIGNSTNYFAKSITLLIRKNAYDLYMKYFDQSLSPNSNTKSKTRADKDSLPKTRTVYSSYDKQYLPGFIKIYYD